jgi:hypothetical protein
MWSREPDEPRVRLDWMDRQLLQTGWPMLLALAALFFVPVWIFSVVGLAMATHPYARRKAKILFVICTAYAAFVAVVIYKISQSEM